MKKPFLIVIDGPMGSGKTTLSQKLHKKIKNVALISLDKIKIMVPKTKYNYEDLSLAAHIGKLITREYLKRNINVIVEKAFTEERFLKSFIKGLDKSSKILIYQLDAPLEERILRIRKRESLNAQARRQPLSKIKKNSRDFKNKRYKGAKIFNSHNTDSDRIVEEIIREIN